MVELSYDPAKRAKTLKERGLDFADAATVFAGLTMTIEDARHDYGETRYQSYGLLDERLVMLVWTTREGRRHIISMRKCNEREQAQFGNQLG